MKDIFSEILKNTPACDKIKIEDQMEIALRINRAMKKKGWKQVDLANALGKKKSEICKYLSGTHNFTIETLSKIQAALGVRFIFINNMDYSSELENSKSLYDSTRNSNMYSFNINENSIEYKKGKNVNNKGDVPSKKNSSKPKK